MATASHTSSGWDENVNENMKLCTYEGCQELGM